jgi:hypothetical protein
MINTFLALFKGLPELKWLQTFSPIENKASRIS